MKSLAFVALLASFAVSSAAHAQEAEKKDKADPDRLICRSEEQTGTRLGKHKRCLTKAQWEEDRRLSRQEIDKSQMGRYKNN